MGQPLQRCTPEEVGIPSKTMENLLDKLAQCETEPHGLMVMRYGKVCFSGWWKPYAANLLHGLQSMTKTFSGTAIGMLITEEKLSLDTRITTLFPEQVPENPSAHLLRMTVRDVLCMGTGMETAAPASEHWIKDFFRTPVPNAPGTAFYYNNPGSNLLAAIVNKVSGQSMTAYLEEHLFPYIGIDKGEIACLSLPDGTEIGGGGMFARLEDCMRLMLLYMNDGVAGEKRLLSRDWVKLATSCQNAAPNPTGILDCRQGYGFQMWQCSFPGAYRADGALGQYVVCFPKQELMIGIFETASYPAGVQQVLDAFYSIVPSMKSDVLPDNPADFARLQERAAALKLDAPFGERNHRQATELSGGRYKLSEGKVIWMPAITWQLMGKTLPEVESLVLQKNEDWHLTLNTTQGPFAFRLPADGTTAVAELPGMFPYDLAYVQACACAANELKVEIRYIKTCYHVLLSLRTEQDRLYIETRMKDMQPVQANAVAMRCKTE